MKERSVLEVGNIHKNFPGIRALQAVGFTPCKEEIYALMGGNRAGKSILVKVLTGVYEKDKGEIYLSGLDKLAIIKPPQDTRNLSISTVYQEITLCSNPTVAGNIYIGRGKSQIASWRKINGDAGRILDSLGIPAQATQQLSDCSVAIQQMVAIARAAGMDCKVLILSESASSLDESKMEELFDLIRNLKTRGVDIIFITHFLDQAYEVCDKIAVLQDGQLVDEYVIGELPWLELVARMLDKELDDMGGIKGETTGHNGGDEYVTKAEGLQSDAGIKPFDFRIRRGEVDGSTSLLGFRWSEHVRALSCVDKVTADTIKKSGKPIKITKPLGAMKNGIAHLPKDGKRDSIVGDLPMWNSIILAAQVLHDFLKPFSRAKTSKLTKEYVKLLEIKTTPAGTPIGSLSDGNQQKVMLARWLLTHPEYLILDEPTRDIDTRTRVEIQKLVLKLASEGMSPTFISPEMDEMPRICSRLIIMRDRRVVRELSNEDLTQNEVMETIAGGGML